MLEQLLPNWSHLSKAKHCLLHSHGELTRRFGRKIDTCSCSTSDDWPAAICGRMTAAQPSGSASSPSFRTLESAWRGARPPCAPPCSTLWPRTATPCPSCPSLSPSLLVRLLKLAPTQSRARRWPLIQQYTEPLQILHVAPEGHTAVSIIETSSYVFTWTLACCGHWHPADPFPGQVIQGADRSRLPCQAVQAYPIASLLPVCPSSSTCSSPACCCIADLHACTLQLHTASSQFV